MALGDIFDNKFVKDNFRLFILIGIIILLGTIFTAFNPRFIRITNIMNIARQTAVLAVVGIGITFVIISKGIDLSTGSLLAVTGAAGVIVFGSTGSVFLAFLTSILTGAVFGCINGLVIGFTSVSPFMITLGTMALARGLTIGIMGGTSIGVSNPFLLYLGAYSIGIVPVSLILVLFLYFIFDNVLKNTVYGRWVYAVGGNITASKMSGIKTKLVITSVYILTGIMCGIGGIMTVGRLSSAQPWAGRHFEFEVITAVILGGTSLFGGIGTIKGTFLGAIIVGMLRTGLGLMGLSPYVQYIVRGSMILFAVFLDNYSRTIEEKLSKSSSESINDSEVIVEGGS